METRQQDKYIEVGIGEERYALRIDEIHEIIKMQEITRIPSSELYVKGVINLRGKIVPIISLQHRFGLPEESYTKSTRIIVVNHGGEMVGLVVATVKQVTTFSDIQPPPELIGGLDGSYISGIGRTETGLISVLKLEQLLPE